MSLNSNLFSEFAWKEISSSLRLSGREVQIAHCVFNDAAESEIAAALGMSPHTVHTHLSRLFQKLGVNSRTELTLRLMREFLTLTRQRINSQCPHTATNPLAQCPVCRLFG